MARYLRASGNWNGAVWAATSDGVAGSAATPTASDDVYINANYSVTLTANATAKSVYHTNGTLSLGSYTLSCQIKFDSGNTTARTINMGSGSIFTGLSGVWFTGYGFNLWGSNLTFNCGTSLVVINSVTAAVPVRLATLSKVFYDVQINIGTVGSTADNCNITGSPTFRSLVIQSKNSAAHTVNFANANMSLDKLILIGSSSSNKLTINAEDAGGGEVDFNLGSSGTSYGQFVTFTASGMLTSIGASGTGPLYIGSNSTLGPAYGFIAQDPPKISTLVDPLTTAPGSNPNWTVTGTVTQVTNGHEGGGYKFDNSDSIISSDTYDMVDSEIVVEIPPTPAGAGRIGINVGWEYDPPTTGGYGSAIYNGVFARAFIDAWEEVISTEVPEFDANGNDTGDNSPQDVATLPTSIPYYIKFYADSSTNRLHVRYSSDGINYSNANSYYAQLTDIQMLYLRTARVSVGASMSGSEYATIGSINTLYSGGTNSSGNFLAFFYP